MSEAFTQQGLLDNISEVERLSTFMAQFAQEWQHIAVSYAHMVR